MHDRRDGRIARKLFQSSCGVWSRVGGQEDEVILGINETSVTSQGEQPVDVFEIAAAAVRHSTNPHRDPAPEMEVQLDG